MSRRGFLSSCGACAVAAGTWASAVRTARAADANAPVRVRAVFSHAPTGQITWPNIGYDYEAHKSQMLEMLRAKCAGIEFLPVTVLDADAGKGIMEQDSEVDGYFVDFVGMGAGGATLVPLLAEAGRPTVIADNLFAGGGTFLNINTRAHAGNWKVVGLATSNPEDIAAVVQCFDLLRKPGTTVDDFYTQAEAARKERLPRQGALTCAADTVKLASIEDCIKKLRDTRILVVGASGMSGDGLIKSIGEVFGTQVTRIDFPEMHEAWSKVRRDDAERWADSWTASAQKILEADREDIVGAGAMYVAMRDRMEKYDAQAIAIHCLGGFYGGHLKAYPCLGFTQLNDTGLVGACEADLMSTVTMLALGYMTGRPGFISDPVIDTAKNQIIYAHCVAPSKVFGPDGPANPVHIRSHSEDRHGAALRSLMPLGYMTTSLKFDPIKRQTVLHRAKTVENVDLDQACRTKLAAEIDGSIEKLLNNWSFGWHRVTFYGDLVEPVVELSKALGLEVVMEA